MKLITVQRIFRAGLQDFWRNGFVSFASVFVMTLTLFSIGIALFAGVIVNFALTELKDKADVNVYFTVTAPEDQILSLKSQLEQLPEVAAVEYVSRDQALANFRELHANDQLTLQALDELGTNPLGAVLNVKAKDISQYEAVATFLNNQATISSGQASIIDKINFYDVQHRAALDRLQTITTVGKYIGLAIISLFILITILISFNTLRLAIYTSRDEIHVMRLVGAERSYIRLPFMVEGVLYGLIAGVVTLLMFYPLTWWLGNATQNFFGGVNVFHYYLAHFVLFFGATVGTGVILGAIASWLAVRRYLKI